MGKRFDHLINPSEDRILQALADMHRAMLPSSLISKLGQHYSTVLYRFGVSSPQEKVVAIMRDDGALIGGTFLSFNPANLSRRLALREHH